MDIYNALAGLSAAYVQQDGVSALQEDWAGIGFRVGTQRFLAAQDEVAEVLSPPRCARVPGAPDWVRGLANLRGTVIPLYDLGHLLLGTPTPVQSRNRYLVLADAENPAGFLVDAVTGLRRFSRAQMQSADGAPVADDLAEFVTGVFTEGDELRPVFSLQTVLLNRLATQVAG